MQRRDLRLHMVWGDTVAAGGSVDDHKERVDDLKVKLKENIDVGRVERVDVADGQVVDTYLHRQEGRGVNAVVVVLEADDPQLYTQVRQRVRPRVRVRA